VVAGDTLWSPVNENYGENSEDRTFTLVKIVAAANLIGDPDHIIVGALIYFPSLWP